MQEGRKGGVNGVRPPPDVHTDVAHPGAQGLGRDGVGPHETAPAAAFPPRPPSPELESHGTRAAAGLCGRERELELGVRRGDGEGGWVSSGCVDRSAT